jgi:hypothetical protein
MVALTALWVIAILPAQAATPEPTRVPGSADCASVGSAAESSLKIEPVSEGTYTLHGVEIEIVLSEVSNTFGFSLSDGEVSEGAVHDVIVKGSASNWYHYDDPSDGDSGLTIPNGNSLKHAIFCFEFDGQPMPCGEPVGAEGENANASFTRVENCDGDKRAFVDIDEDDVVTFIPRGEGTSNYEGTLSFVKPFDDPNLLVLQYDPDADGPAGFKDMQACDFDSGEGISYFLPAGETWCYFGVMAETNGDGLYDVTWEVFGTEDPKFR